MSETFFKKNVHSLFFVVVLLLSKVAFSEDSINYSGSGDNKDGYDSKNYTTKSLSLDHRKGKKANLVKYALRNNARSTFFRSAISDQMTTID